MVDFASSDLVKLNEELNFLTSLNNTLSQTKSAADVLQARCFETFTAPKPVDVLNNLYNLSYVPTNLISDTIADLREIYVKIANIITGRASPVIQSDIDNLNNAIGFLNKLRNAIVPTRSAATKLVDAHCNLDYEGLGVTDPVKILNTLYDSSYVPTNKIYDITINLGDIRSRLEAIRTSVPYIPGGGVFQPNPNNPPPSPTPLPVPVPTPRPFPPPHPVPVPVPTPSPFPPRPVPTPSPVPPVIVVNTPSPTVPVSTVPATVPAVTVVQQPSNVLPVVLGIGIVGALAYGAYWYINKAPGMKSRGGRENPLNNNCVVIFDNKKSLILFKREWAARGMGKLIDTVINNKLYLSSDNADRAADIALSIAGVNVICYED